jgi:NADPH:quinone reductase
MNAWAIEQFGLPAQMQPEKLEVPKVSARDVLIRMRGAEIGDWDAAAISGDCDVGRRSFPLVVGLAGAGTVAAAGKDVLGFAEGEAVYVYNYPLIHPGCPSKDHNGAWAEYMLVPFSNVARAPASLDLTRAGALPIAGLTAHEAITDRLKVQKRDVVLITGAAGGVGHLAVQIARRLGAHVIATARKAHHQFLHDLGAELVIDYTLHDFVEVIRKIHPTGVDKALNCVAGETANQAVRAVRPGGQVVDLTASATAELPGGHVETEYVVQPSASRLARVARMIDDEELRLEIEDIAAFSDAPRALARVLNGHVRGKVVLRIP